MILVTGGAGFIGSNYILEHFAKGGEEIINLDLLTYAGNLRNLESVSNHSGYQFVKGDIGDIELVGGLLKKHRPRAIINFAAESHVDRSITGPGEFIRTNVLGTFHLLQNSLEYWKGLNVEEKDAFRFIHISTDEVYGSLEPDDPAFRETNKYFPNSPYSASKASSDHLVRAYHHTYGLPLITSNCSNNYGYYQFPEKLIPLILHNALQGKTLPIYGDGLQIRDWLFVTDHCDAIALILEKGKPGETYNIGGRNEITNLEVVNTLCNILDEEKPLGNGKSYSELITFVADRPGHDRRYAIDADKIESELGWTPKETFDTGIRKTVRWYLENEEWVKEVTSGAYRDWISKQYSVE